MFQINDDLSINITRGDTAVFTVNALNEAGENYLFQKGDVIRIKVTEKKACENVMFQKDFVVEEETEQVEILLTEQDTKIGEVISKPTDYWYEIELNPFTNPQTIIGYDEDGAKIFKLFPEGKDIEPIEPTPEDIPVVDEELDITSERPVQNQAITRAMLNLQEEIERVEDTKNITSEDLEPLAVGIEENKGNIAKNTGNIEDLLAHAKNTSNPHNVTANQVSIDNSASGLSANNVQGAIDDVVRTLGYTKSYNELENKATTTTINGLTFTVNNDKSVTVNGTATADTFLNLNYDGTNVFDDGNHIVSGGDSKVWLEVITNNNVFVRDKGENVEFTIENTSNNWARLFVDGGTVVNNVTVYPMVRPSHIEDDTYEPYVADLKSLVCDVEKIDVLKNVNFVAHTSTLIHTYKTTKRCELSMTVYVYGENTQIFPTLISAYIGNRCLAYNKLANANGHAMSMPVNVILEAGETVAIYSQFFQAGNNSVSITGYIRNLE